MRLALTDIYQAKWTEEIHREWIYNLLKNRPDLTENQLLKIKEKMNMHVRDSLVEGYEKLINKLILPDPNDRHVLAAAIHAKAQLIITFNLRDFPAKTIAQYNLQAQNPDDFLVYLLGLDAEKVISTVRETRQSLKNPPKNPQEYLDTLKLQSLPKITNYLHKYIHNI